MFSAELLQPCNNSDGCPPSRRPRCGVFARGPANDAKPAAGPSVAERTTSSTYDLLGALKRWDSRQIGPWISRPSRLGSGVERSARDVQVIENFSTRVLVFGGEVHASASSSAKSGLSIDTGVSAREIPSADKHSPPGIHCVTRSPSKLIGKFTAASCAQRFGP